MTGRYPTVEHRGLKSHNHDDTPVLTLLRNLTGFGNTSGWSLRTNPSDWYPCTHASLQSDGVWEHESVYWRHSDQEDDDGIVRLVHGYTAQDLRVLEAEPDLVSHQIVV